MLLREVVKGAAWEAARLGLWMLPEMLVVVAVLAWRWLVAEQWKCVYLVRRWWQW